MSLLDLFRRLPPRDAFAKRFIQSLRAHGETRSLDYDATEFVIRASRDGEAPSHIFSLHNAFRECQRTDPSEHEAIIARYASSWNLPSIPDDYGKVAGKLRLAIKDRTYSHEQKLRHQVDFFGDEKAHRIELATFPVSPDLVACLVWDEADSLHFVNVEHLSKWQVPIEQVARDALRDMRAAIEWNPTPDGNLFRSQMNDAFDSSRVLFVDEIRALPLKGAPVALVPDRESLLIAGADDPEGLRRLAELGRERFEQADRLISGHATVLRGNVWEAFDPPEALATAFGNLRRLYDARYCADQKTLMEKLFELQQEDIFVATLTLFERTENGRYSSRAVWSRDVLALLPRADEITFYDDRTERIHMADWDAVVRVMGDRMIPTSDLPPRWRVDTFPSNEELLSMGARSAAAASD
jgi:hypothetical protein